MKTTLIILSLGLALSAVNAFGAAIPNAVTNANIDLTGFAKLHAYSDLKSNIEASGIDSAAERKALELAVANNNSDPFPEIKLMPNGVGFQLIDGELSAEVAVESAQELRFNVNGRAWHIRTDKNVDYNLAALEDILARTSRVSFSYIPDAYNPHENKRLAALGYIGATIAAKALRDRIKDAATAQLQ
jgi:hypothetical protein